MGRRRIAFLGLVALAAVCACVSVPSAAATAPADDPITNPACFWTKCPGTPTGTPSFSELLGMTVVGGGGFFQFKDFTDLPIPDNSTAGGKLRNWLQVTRDRFGYRPPVWRVAALRTLAIGGAAYTGWKIGTTADQKYLHMRNRWNQPDFHPAGVTSSAWVYQGDVGCGTSCSNPFQNEGYYLNFTTANGTLKVATERTNNTAVDVGCTPQPGPSPAEHKLIADAIPAMAGVLANSVVIAYSSGGTCGPAPNVTTVQRAVYITKQNMDAAFEEDRPPVDFASKPAGDPVTVTTGPKVRGGCGDTSDACANPGTGPLVCGYNAGGAIVDCWPKGTTPTAVAPVGGFPTPTPTDDDPITEEVRCALDPTRFGCPHVDDDFVVPTDWTMPSCTGLALATCTGLIGAAASGAHVTPPAITTIDLGIEGAILTQPAGAVALQSPVGGATISPGMSPTVQLRLNPDPLPKIVPTPGPWVLDEPYCDAITEAGLICVIAPLNTPDPLHGPHEVTRVIPAPGTRVAPGTTVTVRANPEVDANGDPVPFPPGDPNTDGGADTPPPDADPPDVPGPGGSSDDSPCKCPPINFEPLLEVEAPDKFPFGVFDYAAEVIDQFNVAPHAPRADVALGLPGVASHFVVDLDGGTNSRMGWLDTYMGWWRTLVSWCLWVGSVWFVGTKLLGYHGTNPGEAVDDAL